MRHLSFSAALVAGCLIGSTSWAQVGGGSVGGGSIGGGSVGSSGIGSSSVGGTPSSGSALPPEPRTGNAPSLSNQGLMGTGGRISNQGLQSSSGSIAEEGLQDITGSPQDSDIGSTGLPTGSPPAISSTQEPEVDLGPRRDIIARTPRLPPGTEGSRVGSPLPDGNVSEPTATGTLRGPTGGAGVSGQTEDRESPLVERLIQEEVVQRRGICEGC